MRSMLFLLLTLTACNIKGLNAGDPCNNKGQCAPGLVCRANVCEALGQAGAWQPMNVLQKVTHRGIYFDQNVSFTATNNGLFSFDEPSKTWRKFDGFDSPVDSSLLTMWARGPNDIWIAGQTGAARFDGTSWSDIGVTNGGEPLSNFTIYQIDGNQTDIYAIGTVAGAITLFHHFDGEFRTRESISTEELAGTPAFVVTDTDAYVVGNGRAIHRISLLAADDTPDLIFLPGSNAIDLRAVTRLDTRIIAMGMTDAIYVVALGNHELTVMDNALPFTTGARSIVKIGQDLLVGGTGVIARCLGSDLFCTREDIDTQTLSPASVIHGGYSGGRTFMVGTDAILELNQ